MLTRLEVKSVVGDVITLEGYPVVFDSVDLDGEIFSAATDFWERYLPADGIPILFEHGRDKDVGTRILGRVTELEKKPMGLYGKLVLDNLGDLRDRIVQWVEQKKLGLSSGTAAHLMERAGNRITKWPLVEVSLTQFPKEVNTMSLEFAAKSGLLDFRIRQMERENVVDQLWEWVGRDAENRDAWELLADIVELEGEVERERFELGLQRKAKLVQDINKLEEME